MSNLVIVLAVLIPVAGFGAGSMIWAYTGAGSVAVLFQEVISPPQELSPEALQNFQVGIGAYLRRRYRSAIAAFTQVLRTDATCAAAYHNCGLALANLDQTDQATASLLKAAELYFDRGDGRSADLVKQHLIALKTRKLERERKKVDS
jgi:tetratricopeptide (TPR) repeat protein